jgi:L-malate glycosyltransferase
VVEVNQFVHSFVDHDAISSHVRHLRRIISSLGITTDVYAGEWRGDRSKAKSFRDYEAHADDTWNLYHLSTASPIADFLDGRPEHLALNYHNVTPYEFLAPWEPVVAPELEIARKQLSNLASKAEAAIGVSRFNESELISAGYRNTSVAPILFDPGDFENQQDAKVAVELNKAKSTGGIDWLFVGRITPHKCQHQIIQAFAIYKRLYDSKARLHLVGGVSSHLYWTVLKQYAEQLNIKDSVFITKGVSNAALGAYYRNCDVFVCLSEHEGFGVPVLEALWNNMPVVAYNAGAVGEVLGSAGVVMSEKSPALVAAAVHRVASDPVIREQLAQAGQARLEQYSLSHSEQVWREAIEKLVAN